MRRFEYKSFNYKLSEFELNRFGNEGWELVSHTAVINKDDELIQYYVFKRQLYEKV